jgi:hypothetical protein
MPDYIRNVPPGPNLSSGWSSNVGQQVNSNKTVAGGGVVVSKGSNGTTVSIPSELDPVALNYAGVFSFSQSYEPNDVVFVDPQETYWDQNGDIIPVCSGSSASGLPNICGGLFVCTRFVPPFGYDSTFLTDTLATYYNDAGQHITGGFADTFRWYSLNVYWPIYPLIPTNEITTSSQAVGEDTLDVTANINFWAPLSPMYLGLSCDINGNNISTFNNGIISGSMFNLTQLPFVG